MVKKTRWHVCCGIIGGMESRPTFALGCHSLTLFQCLTEDWRGFEVLPPCSSPRFHPSGCRDIWSHYTPHFKGSRGFQLQCGKGMQWLSSSSLTPFFLTLYFCCITYAFLPSSISLSVIYYFCSVKCFIFFPFSFSVMVYFFDF